MARRGRGAAGRPAAHAGGWRAGDAGSHATLSDAHRPRLRGGDRGDRGDREASRSRARLSREVCRWRRVPRPSALSPPIPAAGASGSHPVPSRKSAGNDGTVGAAGPREPNATVPAGRGARKHSTGHSGPRARGRGGSSGGSRSPSGFTNVGGRGAGAGGMEQSQRCVPRVPRHSRGCGGRTSVRLVAVASRGSCSSEAPSAGEELGAGRRRRGPRRHALARRDSSAGARGARGARASFREAGSTSRRAAAHGQGDGADRTGLRFSPVWAKDDVRGAS